MSHQTVQRMGGTVLQPSLNMISSLSAPTQVCNLVSYLDGSSISGENFGATRHMVNNCWEDSSLTSAPFSNFLAGLVRFAEAVHEKKTTRLQVASGEDEEDEEELQFLDFLQES